MNYKDKINGYRPEVDVDAWNSMQQLLDQQAMIDETSDEKRTLFGWLKRFLLLLILVLIVMIGGTYFWNGAINTSAKAELIEVQARGQEKLTSEKSPEDLNEAQDVKLEKEGLEVQSQKLLIEGKEDNNVVKVAVVDETEIGGSEKEEQSNSMERKGVHLNNELSDRKPDSTAKGLNQSIHSLLLSTGIEEKQITTLEENYGGSRLSQDKSVRDEAQSASISTNKGNPSTESTAYTVSLESDKSEITNVDISLSTESTNLRSLISIDRLVSEPIITVLKKENKLLGDPEFVKPLQVPSKFLLGVDAGSANYFDFVTGEAFSLFGLYEIYPWWRAGLRLNHTAMRDQTEYVLNPEVKRRRTETSVIFFTQIVPLRIWRFNAGFEGGYGVNDSTDRFRRLRNPEPNVVFAEEEQEDSMFDGIHAGVFLTFKVSSHLSFGTSINSNITSEAVQYVGRIVYRFK